MVDVYGSYFEEVRRGLVDFCGDEVGSRFYSLGLDIANQEERKEFYVSILKALMNGDAQLELGSNFLTKFTPVDVETFMLDPYYLNLEDTLYPEVKTAMKELNNGTYQEAVLTGGIGVAKTTIAVWSQAYQLYLLSSLINPQKVYGLDRASEIVIVFQSLNATLAKELDYARFRSLIETTPYFQDQFQFDTGLESQLVFPNRIYVKPVSGEETAAIGQNVIGGIIDEINFMSKVENSKKATDGGTYDQAVALYNSISRRRKSRFNTTKGILPGLLCAVSSARSPEDFTIKKMEEAKRDETIFVYNKKIWDVKPKGTFSEKTFRVFVGDATTQPRILGDDEVWTGKGKVIEVPIDYEEDFRQDLPNALREIAGEATMSISPFLRNSELVKQNFGRGESVADVNITNFEDLPLNIYPDMITNKTAKRYCHIDLSLTTDRTGIVIGHVERFIPHKRKNEVEFYPEVHIDLALQVVPTRSTGEIEYHKIRELLYKLRELGMPIEWVSFDSYQSNDSVQVLRQKGFKTGQLSMDTSPIPYHVLKSALYRGDVHVPTQELLLHELNTLEIDYRTGKIDHPATSSKDVADCLAGVVYGLTMRREIWAEHGIDPNSNTGLKEIIAQEQSKEK